MWKKSDQNDKVRVTTTVDTDRRRRICRTDRPKTIKLRWWGPNKSKPTSSSKLEHAEMTQIIRILQNEDKRKTLWEYKHTINLQQQNPHIRKNSRHSHWIGLWLIYFNFAFCYNTYIVCFFL